MHSCGLDKIIEVTSSTNTKEADEKLRKFETELQSFKSRSNLDITLCFGRIRKLEKDLITALKTANQSKVSVNSSQISNEMPNLKSLKIVKTN